LVAIVLGVCIAGFTNNDSFHGWLRNRRWYLFKRTSADDQRGWRWTIKTSFPSQWYSGFVRFERWIVLHLDDGRRLYGWAEEWPDSPDGGQFLMMDAEWLVEVAPPAPFSWLAENAQKPEQQTSIKLPMVERILIPSTSVKMVEFMRDAASANEKGTH
jgi:hypothetical protein